MLLQEITEKKELNVFVAENPEGQFVQSFEWGEFQQSLGRQVWRVGVYDELGSGKQGNLMAVGTVIEHPLGLGKTYLYCPYGPLFAKGINAQQTENVLQYFLTELRNITIETHTKDELFARLEPRLDPLKVGNFFVHQGFKKTHAMQPQDTQVVNLQEDEAWILKQMHSKTRYNIRLAERKGVTIRQAQEAKDFEIFWQLLQMTTDRDQFQGHEKSYYEQLWNYFRESKITDQMHLTVKILIAEREARPIAASMLGFFGGRVTYLHGASNHQHRQVMAPHLLQWHGMQLGKEHGYLLYDFNGIKPANRPLDAKSKEHAWEGITRFKKGFGGHEVNYVGAWDWVYDKAWYGLYKLAHKVLVRK